MPSMESVDDDWSTNSSTEKINKKYCDLKGQIVVVEVQKGPNGLGLSLAGHKDRTKMSTFIVGLNPSGNAFKDGRIQVGDEILEVNGHVLHGRCHLNASAIIKGLIGPTMKLILLRRDDAFQDLAVKPITQFPVQLGEEASEDKYSRYRGVRTITLKKGPQGLGIMIIEGKHAEVGQGIFISDIQEGSAAEQAGLTVGDMILAVNEEDIVKADYELATSILKKADGVIRLIVSNPNKTPSIEDKDSLGQNLAPSSVQTLPRTPDKITDKKDDKKEDKPIVPQKPPILMPKPTFIPPKSTSAHALPLAVDVTSSSTFTKSISVDSHITTIIVTMANTPTTTTVNHSETCTSTISIIPTCESPTMHSPKLSSWQSTDEPPADPSICEIHPGQETTIEITKEKMGLGLSIVGGSDTLLGAIIIHEVYPDGAAAKDGRLRPGDQILEVNNENLRDATHDRAIAALRQTPAKVKMVVYREEGQSKEEDIYDIMEVELIKKPGKGLGLSIVGRKNGPGVFISDVVRGGVAEADGRLMQGDQILSVNGQDLKNAKQEQAAAILKTTMGRILMKIGRLKASSRRSSSGGSSPKPKPNGTSDGKKK